MILMASQSLVPANISSRWSPTYLLLISLATNLMCPARRARFGSMSGGVLHDDGVTPNPHRRDPVLSDIFFADVHSPSDLPHPPCTGAPRLPSCMGSLISIRSTSMSSLSCAQRAPRSANVSVDMIVPPAFLEWHSLESASLYTPSLLAIMHSPDCERTRRKCRSPGGSPCWRAFGRSGVGGTRASHRIESP